jgi:hypothetical protein
MDKQLIKLSKAKILLGTTGSIAFLAVGVWLATLNPADPGDTWYWRQHNPYFVHGVGILGALVFGICAVWWAVKMFDTKPGLILEYEGFTDNSSPISPGFVPWSDVTGLSVFKIKNTRSLVITVSDPDRYIKRGNAFRRALIRSNVSTCGSPIRIASNDLTVNFDELFRVFESYWQAWKDTQQSSRSMSSLSAS